MLRQENGNQCSIFTICSIKESDSQELFQKSLQTFHSHLPMGLSAAAKGEQWCPFLFHSKHHSGDSYW